MSVYFFRFVILNGTKCSEESNYNQKRFLLRRNDKIAADFRIIIKTEHSIKIKSIYEK